MAPAKSSFAYNFFNTSPDGNYSKCKLCYSSLKNRGNGSTCHMVRHLHTKHPDKLAKSTSLALAVDNNHPPLNVEKKQDYTPFLEQPHDISNIMSKTQNEISFDPVDIKLIHPFSLIISGPTSSGKSFLLFQILDNLHQNIKPVIERVVYIYGVYQEVFKDYPNIFFTDDLDYMDLDTDVPTLIVLDDVMSSINNSKKLEELFTRGVHHRKVSVVLTLQNLFYHGSVMKTLRDNAMYIALTKHIQDVSKLDTFARQLERKNSNYFKDSYQDATSRKYGYLLCDMHPHSNLRDGQYKIKYRSLIHKPEGQVVYLPKAQGMLKATIQSGIPDASGKLTALVKSGKTIPDSFIFQAPVPKKASLLPQQYHSPDKTFVKNKVSNMKPYLSKPHKPCVYERDTEEDSSESSELDDDEEMDSDGETDGNDGSEYYDEEEDVEVGDVEEEDVEEEEEIEDVSDEEDGKEEAYDDTTENAKARGFNDYPLSSGSFPIHSMTESSRILFLKKSEWFRWFKNQPWENQYKTLVHCNDNFIIDLDKLIKHVTYSKNVSLSPQIKTLLWQHKGFIYRFIEHHSLKKRRALLLQQVQRIDLNLLLNCLLLSISKKKV